MPLTGKRSTEYHPKNNQSMLARLSDGANRADGQTLPDLLFVFWVLVIDRVPQKLGT